MASTKTRYNRRLANEICARMALGETVRQICRDPKIKLGAGTVRGWAVRDVDGFRARYAEAREAMVDAWSEEIIDVADDGANDWMDREASAGRILRQADAEHINRSRLRVHTRQWLMSKIVPGKYGDRQETQISGPDGGPVQVEDRSADAQARLTALTLLIARGGSVEGLTAPTIEGKANPSPPQGEPQEDREDVI